MNTIEIVLGIWSVLASAIAVYQFAVIRTDKRRKFELQHLLAGVNNSALQKQVGWNNQLASVNTPEAGATIAEIRVMIRARDDLGEIASLVLALEGTIDTESSAISSMVDKAVIMARKNAEFQEVFREQVLKNAGPVPVQTLNVEEK